MEGSLLLLNASQTNANSRKTSSKTTGAHTPQFNTSIQKIRGHGISEFTKMAKVFEVRKLKKTNMLLTFYQDLSKFIKCQSRSRLSCRQAHHAAVRIRKTT